MDSLSANEVDSFSCLWGTCMFSVEDAVVECVAKLSESVGERFPERSGMGSPGGGYVLENERFWLEGGDSMDADFSSNSSALCVADSLFFAERGEWLAGKTRDVEVYSCIGFYVWFGPCIRS